MQLDMPAYNPLLCHCEKEQRNHFIAVVILRLHAVVGIQSAGMTVLGSKQATSTDTDCNLLLVKNR